MKREITSKIPQIKKNVKDFIADENGFVSKDKILKVTFMISMGSVLFSPHAQAQTTHANSISGSFSGTTVSGSHSHHANHTSY